MRLQIIGENAAKLSDKLQDKYPEIPWNRIIGLRNIISHAYDDLIVDQLWLTLTNELPKLKSVVKTAMTTTVKD